MSPTKPNDATARALWGTLMSPNVFDLNAEDANVVDVINFVANAGFAIARELSRLGNADAGTPMGAMEAFGLTVKETGEKIADAISDLADAVRSAR